MAWRLPVRATLCSAARFELGAPVVRGDLVESVDRPDSSAPPWFAIPGLRNAHVHLDLSEVRGVPRAQHGFARWVIDLLRARGTFAAEPLARGAARGAASSLAAGTTAVVDIDSSGAAAAVLATSGLRGLVCREVLGSRDPAEVRRGVEAWLTATAAAGAATGLRAGISPHAPYSTPPALYRIAAELAVGTGCGYTTHLAETLAERRFLRSGDGEFRDLLSHLGAAAPFDSPPGLDPVRYVAGLHALPRGAIVAHVNHPTDGDADLLREAGAIVAYCPRSHAFFGHPRHPIRELMAGGVRVALGTDSLASNGSLSLLDELAYARVARPDLSAATLFDSATAVAAREIDRGSGTVAAGEAADLAILASPSGAPADHDEALAAVCSGAVRVVATIVAGVVRYVDPAAARTFASLTGLSPVVSSSHRT